MQRFAVTVLVLLSALGAQPQGLFPPFDFSIDLARFQPTSSTSTCGQCLAVGDPACPPSCNNTCPYGNQLPTSVPLLETGLPAEGVVSLEPRACSIKMSLCACMYESSSSSPLMCRFKKMLSPLKVLWCSNLMVVMTPMSVCLKN